MLILFRTNPGFEGQIITVDKTTLAPEMDAKLQSDPEYAVTVDYLEIDEYSIGREAVKDFALNRDKYAVDLATKRLRRDGQPVAWG